MYKHELYEEDVYCNVKSCSRHDVEIVRKFVHTAMHEEKKKKKKKAGECWG